MVQDMPPLDCRDDTTHLYIFQALPSIVPPPKKKKVSMSFPLDHDLVHDVRHWPSLATRNTKISRYVHGMIPSAFHLLTCSTLDSNQQITCSHFGHCTSTHVQHSVIHSPKIHITNDTILFFLNLRNHQAVSICPQLKNHLVQTQNRIAYLAFYFLCYFIRFALRRKRNFVFVLQHIYLTI